MSSLTMADKPISFAEHCQLQSLGISQEFCTFANCTLESERFVCVRENNQVCIVDLNDANNV